MISTNTAKIIAITHPLLDGINTAEEFIAYCARVSNPSNQMNTETSEKLLKYCIRNKHFSIFEMVNVVMQIDTTRDIARQILRHRSFSFQEFSQRYADPTSDLGFSHSREARLQDLKNRQNSVSVENAELQEWFNQAQQDVAGLAGEKYKEAIAKGIAKEQARAVLPEGIMNSRLYMNGTLRSFIHYVELRSDNGTQKEHQEIAISAREQLLEHFPFLKHVWSE